MHKEIRRDLWLLAWPAAMAMVVHHLFRLNDQYFVKDLGIDAQAAVAVGSMTAIFLVAFGEMVGVGTMAIAARRFGEGNLSEGYATIRKGLRLAMNMGIGVGAVGLLILPWLCDQMIPGTEHAAERELCIDYLTWIAGGQVVMMASQVTDQSFLAMKDTRTSLGLQILAVGSNALLNWTLVPHYGVNGVGFATIASRALAVVVGVWILHRRGVGSPFRASGGDARASAKRILRIGFPTCIAVGIYSLVYQVMLAVTIKDFGPTARSALGIGFGLETTFYCLYWGTGSAVASLVGRYLGEGNKDKAVAVTRVGLAWNFALGLTICGVFLVAGEGMVRLLSDNPDVVRTNVQYLNYMAIAQPFQALQVGFDNALIGAGNTLPIMISSVTMNCLRIPLAHLLAVVSGWGLPGVWWAINFSSFGKCAWGAVLYQRKRWLHTEV